MKKIIELVSRHNLRIIDAIVLKKRIIGMVDHYVLFGGFDDNNQPVFVANYKTGVQIVPNLDLINYLEILEPSKIIYFKGDETKRKEAINRAKSRIGEKAYNYLSNNCEHFVTWVHTGKHNSKQVADAGVGLMAAGAVTAIGGVTKKSDTAVVLGFGALLLGALLKFGFNEEQ